MIYQGAGILFVKLKNNRIDVVYLSKRRFKPFQNYWSVPGGKRDYTDKNLLQTAVRETNEEYFQNLKILSYDKFKSKKLFYYDVSFSFLFKFRIYIYPVVSIKCCSKSFEFSSSKWFKINSLPENTHFGVIETINHYQKRNKK